MANKHAKGSSHANLPNLKTAPDSEVNCNQCLAWMNKKVINKIIRESSSYEHSGKKGVDHTRKMPEFAIMGFKSYTTPNYMIRDVVKQSNVEEYFKKAEHTILVALRNFDPTYDSVPYLEAFSEMWKYVIARINDNIGLRLKYTIIDTVLEYRDKELKALSVKCDLGYTIQYILMIIVGKMANIRVSQPGCDKFRLMEQIFSNQSNTSMRNYRCFLKVLLNGDIIDLWENTDRYKEYVPKVLDFDMYETILPPLWMSIHLSYRSEIKLAERGLNY